MNLIRYNRYVRQITNDDGDIIASLIALANGRWGLFDRDEIRLTFRDFETPMGALDFYKEHHA